MLCHTMKRFLRVLQRIESRLWNLQKGDDWATICATTPADIHDIHYPQPTYCHDKVRVIEISRDGSESSLSSGIFPRVDGNLGDR